jgi:DNA polymerase V
MTCVLLGDYQSLSRLKIPMFLERVSAGFPSPAEDYIEKTIDLNELCIQHPAATFFVRVQGESMVEGGIFPNDVLVVDRSLRAKHRDMVMEVFGVVTNVTRSIYRAGYDYAKAGVMLSELVDETGLQDDLFEAVIDEINLRSRATLFMARAAGPAAHAMRRGHLSPAYTTDWHALPDVS